MRVILALLCLFCGSPDDVTEENFDAMQEAKVDKYRTFVSELASSSTVSTAEAPIDLPEGLKEAIEVWTRARD
ncbi:hypothetical protein [Microvirga vignae]|nr:hypothetical protein [Microvirga vignae]